MHQSLLPKLQAVLVDACHRYLPALQPIWTSTLQPLWESTLEPLLQAASPTITQAQAKLDAQLARWRPSDVALLACCATLLLCLMLARMLKFWSEVVEDGGFLAYFFTHLRALPFVRSRLNAEKIKARWGSGLLDVFNRWWMGGRMDVSRQQISRYQGEGVAEKHR